MKLTTLMTIIVSLLASGSMAQKTGYTVSGDIKNLPDGVTFYLIQNKDNGGADTVDRVKSKDQKFVFRGNLQEEGQLLFVKMDTSVVKLAKEKDLEEGKRNSWVRLLVVNSGSIIKLTGDVKDWPAVNIEGSPLTKEHDLFVSNIKMIIKEINEKIDVAKTDSSQIAEAKKEYDTRYLKSLEMIAGSYTVPLLLFNNKNMDLDKKEAAYQQLSGKLQSSYYGKRLKQQIINTRAGKNIGIGKIIPDFQVKNTEGKTESVRKLAMRSKYTLIDFWAWWCIPCRKDIPNLKKVYSAFHDKGFNILSISTDANELKWKQALKEENTLWTNGIQEGTPSKDIFGLFSIPAYILLNDKAEIVMMDMNSTFILRKSVGTMNGSQVFVKDSKGLRGDDLYAVIESLLGKADNK